MVNKKAYYFSLDALIALIVVIASTTAFSYYYIQNKPDTQHVYYAQDIVDILSTMKVREINDTDIQNIIRTSNLTDYNITITEQIGRYWAVGEIETASLFSEAVIASLVPDRFGTALYISVDGSADEIYSNNKDFTNQLTTSKQLVSGLEEGHDAVKGSAARIFLKNINSLASSAFIYFGGYVGDGNISKNINLPDIESVDQVYMELSVNNDFSLYINDEYSGNYTSASSSESTFIVDPGFLENVRSGKNSFEIVFDDEGSYIGGGYIRIDYTSSELHSSDITYQGRLATKNNYLPGIEGIINLYSSFYVPGQIQNMSIVLHYDTDRSHGINSTLFLNIAGETVYEDNMTTDEQRITLPQSSIASLNISNLSKKTVPVRLGFRNFTAIEIVSRTLFGDTVLITDVSGSMDKCDIEKTGFEQVTCPNNPGDPEAQRLEAAKYVNKEFINTILNSTGNRVGLVSYSTTADDFTLLTGNVNELYDDVDNYESGGWTCISCSIHKAAELLSEPVVLNSDTWKYTPDFQFSNPPSEWNQISFDDSTWMNTFTVFGFNNVDFEIPLQGISPDLWEIASDKPLPVDFTSGLNSTANTFGPDQGDDGWDWARGDQAYGTHGDNRQPGDYDMSSHYDPSKLTDGTPHDNSGRIEVEVGGYSCGFNCGIMDSAAFGLQIGVTQEMIDMINEGAAAFISFDYEAFDREYFFGNDDTEEPVWIKARFGDSSQMNYLGYDLDTGQGSGLESGPRPEDSTPEILYDYSSQDNLGFHQDSIRGDFDMDNDASYNSGTFSQDITSFIHGPGQYYLDLGAKFDCSGGYQGDNEGIIAYFDNINIIIRNSTGDFYLRQQFTVQDLDKINSPKLYVYSDDRADIYLNGNPIVGEQSDHDAKYWNIDGMAVPFNYFHQGNNLLAVKLHNDDAESARFDLELKAEESDNIKAMLIMSDGEANYCHGPFDGEMDDNNWDGNCYDSNARQETVDFACYAKNVLNISIFTVAFGDGSGGDTLRKAACCDDCTHFFEANNVSEFLESYQTIAQEITSLEVARANQTILSTGNISPSTLFNDSYIQVVYEPDTIPPEYGIIPITIESPRFNNDISEQAVNIPEGYTISSIRATSYSADKWTDFVQVSNPAQTSVVFDLSEFDNEYNDLGDPFVVEIPPEVIQIGTENTITVKTGGNASIDGKGSPFNRLIYTINIDAGINYTGAYTKANGCNWQLEFEDNTSANIPVPSDYSGTDQCNFALNDYDANDAIDIAAMQFFRLLDIDRNKKLLTRLTADDLGVDVITQGEIPFMWGPAALEVRIWE